MNRNALLTIVLVGGLVWYLAKQSVRIDVGSPGISFFKLSGNGIQINVTLPVLNRSDFTYNIQGFLGSLLYNGSSIGTVTLKQSMPIPARGQAAPEFVTEIGYTALIGPVAAILNKALGVTIPGFTPDPSSAAPALSALRIKGTLYVSGLAVDIDEPLQ